jgi:hypothetical protein
MPFCVVESQSAQRPVSRVCALTELDSFTVFHAADGWLEQLKEAGPCASIGVSTA